MRLMLDMLVVTVTVALLYTDQVSGYGRGAPTSQCGSMTPGHDLTPLNNAESPYSVSVDKSSLKPGDTLQIQIQAAGENFLGFLVQVRDSGDKIVGSFVSPSSLGRLLQCSNPSDTVTHTNNSPKSNLILSWTPPQGLTGIVKVLATVVKDYSRYYVKLSSTPVVVSAASAPIVPLPAPVPQPVPTPSSTRSPAPEPEPEPSPTSARSVSTSEAFAGCGKAKTCLGEPAGCEREGTCKLMFTWTRDGDKMVWEGFRKGSGYVGVGISDDTKMGNDIMFICSESGDVKQYGSRGKSAPSQSSPSPGLKPVKFNSNNGDFYCKFESPLKLASDGVSLVADLGSAQYHVLVASGDVPLSYHGQDRIYSANALSLGKVSVVDGGNKNLLKVHGLCMVAAWIGCAGTGILMSRFFKQTWKDTQLLGTAPWFLVHRSLMGLTVLLTAVGLILVLIHTEGWNYTLEFIKINPHPALGLATVIMAFIQPVMALFRPHPGTDYRYIFNWAHRLIGNSAFIIGVAAIFLAGDLAAIKIETTGYVACLVLYIIVFVIVNLLLTANYMWAEREKSKSEVHPMTEKGSRPVPVAEDQTEDQPGGVVRKCLLLFFVTFSCAIVIALICLIFQFD